VKRIGVDHVSGSLRCGISIGSMSAWGRLGHPGNVRCTTARETSQDSAPFGRARAKLGSQPGVDRHQLGETPGWPVSTVKDRSVYALAFGSAASEMARNWTLIFRGSTSA
jgi:hypothetical protein